MKLINDNKNRKLSRNGKRRSIRNLKMSDEMISLFNKINKLKNKLKC